MCPFTSEELAARNYTSLPCPTRFQLSVYIFSFNKISLLFHLFFFCLSYLCPYNVYVNTSLYVFDHTIKPILLYGCEIWGRFNSTTARFINGTITLDKTYQNLKCQLLHTKFCKFILGVHKKSANLVSFQSWEDISFIMTYSNLCLITDID